MSGRESTYGAVQISGATSCKLFAYPNGRYQDFNVTSQEILLACGVETAVTVAEGSNEIDTPKLQLMRHGIGSNCSMAEFKAMLQQYENTV